MQIKLHMESFLVKSGILSLYSDKDRKIMSNKRATIIGHAIIDVVAGPIPQNFFEASSIPMQDIKMTFGGNGYNEASALRRLGVDVNLISKLGNEIYIYTKAT